MTRDAERDALLAREIVRRGWMSPDQLRRGLEAADEAERPLLELMRSHEALPPEQLAELEAWRASGASASVHDPVRQPAAAGPSSSEAFSPASPDRPAGFAAPDAGSGSRLVHSVARTPGPRPTSPSGVLPPALIQALAARGVRLGETLGAGGMGVVYRGELDDGRPCAVKVLLALGEDLAVRFAREAEAARLVAEDPRVVQRLMVVEAGATRALVLEYIAGGDLRAEMRHAPLDVQRALELTADLAEALQTIHDAGVLHRDLKPENVLLREDGTPVITDFGLARLADAETLTRTREALGTAHYMSPEQAAGDRERLGPATDIWALGVMLYVMLTGTRPFAADNLVELMACLHEQEPVPARDLNPEVDEALEAILASCLAKLPEQRYPDAAALARDCRLRAAGQAPELARAPRRGLGGRALAVLVLALIILTAGGAFGLHRHRLDRVEDQIAEAFRPLAAQVKELEAELPQRLTESGIATLDEGPRRRRGGGEALAAPTSALLEALEASEPYPELRARFLDSTIEQRDLHAILRRVVEPAPAALPGEIESAFRLAAEGRQADARAVLARLARDPRRRRCAGFARILIALDAGDLAAARTAGVELRSEGLEELVLRLEERALATTLWSVLTAPERPEGDTRAATLEETAELLAQRFKTDSPAILRWQSFLQERLSVLTAGGDSPTMARALDRLEELAVRLPTLADVRAPKEVALRRAERLVVRATRGAEPDRTLLRRAFELYVDVNRLDPTTRLPVSFKNSWIAALSVSALGHFGSDREADQRKRDDHYWHMVESTARLGRVATIFSLSGLSRVRDRLILPELRRNPGDPVLNAILGLLPHRPTDPPLKEFRPERIRRLKVAVKSPLVGPGIKAWALSTLVREQRAQARWSFKSEARLQARQRKLADTYGPRLKAVRAAHPRPWSLAMELARLSLEAERHEEALAEARRSRKQLMCMRDRKEGQPLPPDFGDRDEASPVLPVNIDAAEGDIRDALRAEIKALIALERKRELAEALRELRRYSPRPRELLQLAELELELGHREAAVQILREVPKRLKKSDRARRKALQKALRE